MAAKVKDLIWSDTNAAAKFLFMYKISFNWYGKQFFAPKSNLLLQIWQRDIKKARVFESKEAAEKAVNTISQFRNITDIQIIPS